VTRIPDAYGVRVPDSDEDLERLLRNARPTPRPGYARELERSLALPRRRNAPARSRLAIAGIVVAALAIVTLVAALAGLLPG
jgi:ferric-dicitrate binding protein FerR (iron transport regulator)